jgi:hypothetical protein
MSLSTVPDSYLRLWRFIIRNLLRGPNPDKRMRKTYILAGWNANLVRIKRSKV